MKVLMICFVYNEIKYLPHIINYYRKNSCVVYVIDNMSTDGTWEWMQKNNIPGHRLDTNDSFDLRILQREVENILPLLNPDWIIYSSADLYFVAWEPLKDYIEKVDAMGYNQLSIMCWSAFNTGEKFGIPLPYHYHYAAPWNNVVMISKYGKGFSMNGDSIMIDDARCYTAKHAMAINYGACKPREEQEVKLARRKKAWANGMRPRQGRHFLDGQKNNWIKDKKGLTDLRKVPEFKYIEKIFSFDEVPDNRFTEGSYNEMYLESVIYRKHYSDTVYFPVWKYIVDKLFPDDKILELGCGPGQMAKLLYDKGIRQYTGIDFSSVAIKMAIGNVPSFTFIQANLNDVDFKEYSDYRIISTETFEHLADDTELLKKLPKRRIIFSVPNFMCANHYRTYNSTDHIKEYYKYVLRISDIKPFPIGGNRIIFVIDAQII